MANGVPTQFVYSRLESTAWILVEAIPESLLDQPIPLKSTFMWLAILLDAAVLGAGIYWFIRFLTLRIHTLNDGMSEVAGGNLGIQVDIRSRDEIQGLADGFNAMVRRLNELMNETYMQGIRRKEAELNSLQAQINPHFLYNTLESINWEAMMFTNGPNKVSEMVTALSDLLRLSINKGKEIVMFEDEINHVKNYLFIQKERYMDKFEVEWEIDPHLYAYKTLKLILQPLVENAIYHGLEMKEGIGLIVIKGEIFDDFVQLEIADNGLGMPPEQLEAVRRALKDYKSSQIDGIGIHNVHDRIQLYYGEQYGISLYSEVNVGTRIVICLPLHGPEDRFGSPNFFDQGGD